MTIILVLTAFMLSGPPKQMKVPMESIDECAAEVGRFLTHADPTKVGGAKGFAAGCMVQYNVTDAGEKKD